MTTIYLAGNEILAEDRLPRGLTERIVSRYPDTSVIPFDPTEDFCPAENSIIIDVVKGIGCVKIFRSLSDFSVSPRISVHDYDLYLHLSLLSKTGRLHNWSLIGVPRTGRSPKKTTGEILAAIARIIST